MGTLRVHAVDSSMRDVPTSAIFATAASLVSSMFLDLMSLWTTCAAPHPVGKIVWARGGDKRQRQSLQGNNRRAKPHD